MENIVVRDRAVKIGLPFKVWAALASNGQKIHAPEISGWLNGSATLKTDKVERLLGVLADVEELVASAPVKIDLSTPENVTRALATIPELVEAQRQVTIQKNSSVPVAVSRPVWPARTKEGMRIETPKASKLLAQQ